MSLHPYKLEISCNTRLTQVELNYKEIHWLRSHKKSRKTKLNQIFSGIPGGAPTDIPPLE